MFNFSPNKTVEVQPETPAVYDHGFSTEEVREIEEKYKELERLSKTNHELTLADQITIVKWNRIRRVEAFILNPAKPVKAPKEKKVREVKLKKLSKKDKEKMDNLKLLLEDEILTLETMHPKDKEFYELNLKRWEIS